MISAPPTRFPFLLWLLAGAAVVGAAFPFDERVGALLNAPKDSPLWHLAWWCSKLGEGEIVGGVGILFAVIFFWVNRPRLAAEAFFVAAAGLLTGLSATILRVLVGRTRPEGHGPAGVPPGFYGVWHDGHWIIGKAAYSSFPSGHAAVAVGVAAAAWLVHRGWGVALTIYALAVMWSRVALQWHHLSDVLASAVVAVPLAVLLKNVLLPSVEFQFDNLYRARKKK
ncbi:MAG TPA: phosphatase PAP2 family protein [Verrucomicrobiae bacterium]|nr:phosphatase PAP2 family protein [Verrucomicrobiae bacterium]